MDLSPGTVTVPVNGPDAEKAFGLIMMRGLLTARPRYGKARRLPGLNPVFLILLKGF